MRLHTLTHPLPVESTTRSMRFQAIRTRSNSTITNALPQKCPVHVQEAHRRAPLTETTLIPSTWPQNNPVLGRHSTSSAGLGLLSVSAESASKRLYGTLIVPSTSNNSWKLNRHFPGACTSWLVQKLMERRDLGPGRTSGSGACEGQEDGSPRMSAM